MKPPAAAPGKVRIIGGKWRSRKLDVVEARDLRPTPDRVRETLFNWLQPWIDGATCLDLYAGTGSLGFEALSRGAAAVTMVDSNRTVTDALHRQALRLDAGGLRIVQEDAARFLASRPGSGDDLGHAVRDEEPRPYAAAARCSDLRGLPPAWSKPSRRPLC